VLVAMQNLGINVLSVLAGLGIGGLAFALAAKDAVANFFGSLMILFDRPFQVTSQLADKVPISLTYEDDALVMTVDDQPLVLEMKVRLPVGSHHLTIPYKLDLTSKELLRPVVLPRWLHKTVAVPTRVERKKIVATRPADLALTWHLDLPPENGDFLTITGNLTQKPAVTPH